ncbi:unnamed protein product, partial [Symbiodinium natans]
MFTYTCLLALEGVVFAIAMVFANALKGLDRASCWERGQRLFEDLRLWRSELDAVCYNCAVTTCRQGQQWELAMSHSDASRASHASARQDPILFGGVVAACGQGSAWAVASELLRSAGRARAKLDLVLLSSACTASEKGGRWEDALRAQEETSAAGVPGDVVLQNAALAASPHWPTSLALLQQVGDATVVSFSAVLSACEQAAAWLSALSLLHQTSWRGLEANAIAVATAVAAAVSGEQWPRGLVLLATFYQQGGECDLAACGAVLT